MYSTFIKIYYPGSRIQTCKNDNLVLHNVHSPCHIPCHSLGRNPDRSPCSSLLKTVGMIHCIQKEERMLSLWKKKHFITPWKVLLYNPSVLIKKHSLCRTTHVDPRSGGVGSFCNGVIYPDPTAVELHSICMFLSLASTNVKIWNTYQITIVSLS